MRMGLLATQRGTAALAKPGRADRNPVAVYLKRLAPGSQRTMLQALNEVATIVSSGKADAMTLPWAKLGYQHTQAIRTALKGRYAAATTNKMLSAMKGVL